MNKMYKNINFSNMEKWEISIEDIKYPKYKKIVSSLIDKAKKNSFNGLKTVDVNIDDAGNITGGMEYEGNGVVGVIIPSNCLGGYEYDLDNDSLYQIGYCID